MSNVNLIQSPIDSRQVPPPTIHSIVQSGNIENLTKHLSETPEAIQTPDRIGWTPLHCAVRVGNLTAVELLLKLGASVNAQSESGQTPLYQAVMAGKKECVQLLLRNQADPNLATHEGTTPLQCAFNFHESEIAHLLKQNGASPDKATINFLTILKKANDAPSLIHAFSLLANSLRRGLSPDKLLRDPQLSLHMHFALLHAIQIIHSKSPHRTLRETVISLIQLLPLEFFDFPSHKTHPLLDLAIITDEEQIGCALIQKLSVNQLEIKGHFGDAFSLVFDNNRKEIAVPLIRKLSLEYFMRMDPDPLHTALETRRIEIASALIEKFPTEKINQPSRNGETALDIAVKNGLSDLVQQLQSKGAKPGKV